MSRLDWLTPRIIQAGAGATLADARTWHPHLVPAFEAWDIDTPRRVIAWLAQMGHESAGLTRMVESLNYGAGRLVPMFGEHRITPEQAARYGRTDEQAADQQAIANIVYGGAWGRKNLGNTEPGDGWRFRGHGLIQITGRANHAAVRDGLRERLFEPPDFEQEPEALMQPQWAALSAGWFWHSRKLNALADAPGFSSFELITRRINGGLNGQEDRLRRWRAGMSVLSAVGVPLDPPTTKENP